MLLYSPRVSLVLAGLLAAGCSFPGNPRVGDDEPAAADAAATDAMPGTVDGSYALTVQAYIAEVITRECAKAFACEAEYPQGAAAFAEEWAGSPAECVATDRDYLARELIAASVIAGTITFDLDLAAFCLANLVFPASCTEFFHAFEWPEACYHALLGHLSDGASCTNDWECPFGSICDAICVRV
jgi:hypothetical protein